MDPRSQFFAELKKLAVTLESETDRLRRSFDGRHDRDDSEAAARGMRAYYDLKCDVVALKGQMQEVLSKQKTQEKEVNTFIHACRAVQHKVTQDIQTLKGHFEKYGYQGPSDSPGPNKVEEEEESAAENHVETETIAGSDSLQAAAPPTFTNPMRTPRLSDFGLSERQLRRNMGAPEWCAKVPTMPEMSLPQPALHTPVPPPLTPKCALRMDEDDMRTPQMMDFGLFEHTACLNNDFTMDLFRKNASYPKEPAQDLLVPPDSRVTEDLQKEAPDNWESPEPPVFGTLGFKIQKANGHSSPPPREGSESPSPPGNQPSTPEVPAFKTSYMNRLVSSVVTSSDGKHTFYLPTPCRQGSGAAMWDYDVPELCVLGGEDKPMLPIPNLQSTLGNMLQSGGKKLPFDRKSPEPDVLSMDMDGGATQEFSLGTPRTRMDLFEAGTPEMPDLSSVTQDICKLIKQTQTKKVTTAVVNPQKRAEHNRRCVTAVSEQEFHSLPSFLRQMTLDNLNKAVHNMNKYLAEFPGDKVQFQMEELKKMTSVGIKAPVFILCLSELKRLEPVGGAGNTAVYKLRLHS
ncbi:SKA complex subunit 3 isoform X1 [Nerophis lumbriciformis]|uniref:SKA complex subunit 3 isoform X1 n=2 Tax=Nerophis lumbriciformis TaxID=546530 RepID=UPI002ADF82D8|nr:spindle and kinetochore-associated protein 3-like isoform X1 [Nerophis lumbriciformis]